MPSERTPSLSLPVSSTGVAASSVGLASWRRVVFPGSYWRLVVLPALLDERVESSNLQWVQLVHLCDHVVYIRALFAGVVTSFPF